MPAPAKVNRVLPSPLFAAQFHGGASRLHPVRPAGRWCFQAVGAVAGGVAASHRGGAIRP